MKPPSMINFYNLKLPKEPHYCLVYSKFLDGDKSRQLKAPIFPISVNTLKHKWFEFIKLQPRVQLLSENAIQNQYQYVQRSRVFNFPDIIDVKFILISNSESSIYMYSRSVYGYSDLGVNCKRLKAWLKF